MVRFNKGLPLGCVVALGLATASAHAETLVWLTARPGDGAIVKTVQEIAAEYAGDHPDFALDVQVTADRASYLTKLRTLVASGEVPAFFDTDADPYAQSLAEAGLMVDMGAFLEEVGLLDQFYEPALKYQQFQDGSLYVLPLEYHLEMNWYNKAIFEENGLQPPETLDDMLTLADSLSEAGVTPIAISGTDAWPMLRYLAMVPFREVGNDFIRNMAQGQLDPDMALKAATFFDRISDHFQPGFVSADYVTARSLFLNGEAAMYHMGTWELGTFSDANLPEAMKGNVGYFYLPMAEGAGTPANEFFGNSGIGLAASAATFDGSAKEFLTYLIENYADRYVAKMQLSPLRFELDPAVTYDPLFAAVKADADNYGAEFAKPWDTLLSPDGNQIVNDLAFQLGTNQITPEAFVDGLSQIQ